MRFHDGKTMACEESLRAVRFQWLAALVAEAITMGYSASPDEHLKPWCPPVDVHRTDHQYVVQADLPGLSIEEILVTAKGNTLAISGDRAFDAGGRNVEEHLRLERLHGRFICEIHLPGKLIRDDIRVGYRQGVLSVTIPIE